MRRVLVRFRKNLRPVTTAKATTATTTTLTIINVVPDRAKLLLRTAATVTVST
jgi:hypothetical protein